MGGFIAGGSRDEVELRQLHVTCNVHPPGFHPALIILIVSRMLKVVMPKSNDFKKSFPQTDLLNKVKLTQLHFTCNVHLLYFITITMMIISGMLKASSEAKQLKTAPTKHIT